MVTVTLVGRICQESILAVKVTVTIDTLLKLNRPSFGDGACEQALNGSLDFYGILTHWYLYLSELPEDGYFDKSERKRIVRIASLLINRIN